MVFWPHPAAEMMPREPVVTLPTSRPVFFKESLFEMPLELLPSSTISIYRPAGGSDWVLLYMS
jgi:hypothetical protein